MFSVVDGLLLKPLRYRDAARIVALSTRFTDRGRAIPRITGGDYFDLRADRNTFEVIASYYGGEMGIQTANGAEFVGTMLVDAEFMRSSVSCRSTAGCSTPTMHSGPRS